MNISDLKNKQIAILGFGEKEGKATLEYLLKHEIRPTLFDQRKFEEFSPETQNYIKEKNVPFVFGLGYWQELRSFEIAFRNPSVPFLSSELQNLIQKGLVVTSQTKFFFDNCPAKIVGVTGTKGKGTTASLIYEILKSRTSNLGPKTYLTGNIGKIQPFEFLDNLNSEDLVVYELSSFQLQDLEKSPHVSVVLMTVSEHLDYHKNLKEYWDAKASITKYQTENDISISNLDFEGSQYVCHFTKAKKLYFSTKTKADCYSSEGAIYFAGGKITSWKLKGKHNEQNICAAILAALVCDCDLEVIDKAVKEFNGLEHRLQLVAEKNKIKFYNDSFSTTPETTIAAIKSFTEPLVLILGGSNKNSDFTELGYCIANSKNLKAVVLIGQQAEKIKTVLPKNILLKQGASSMLEIFSQIKEVAKEGDVVLLSPACASFDMFKNYEDRGYKFIKEVEKWQ